MANLANRIATLTRRINAELAKRPARSIRPTRAGARWQPFSRAMIVSEKNEGGVYKFKNKQGIVIYIGSSNKVKRRLNKHLEKSGTCISRNAKKYRVEYTQSYRRREYELYLAHLRRYGEKPRCNAVSPPKPPKFHRLRRLKRIG